MSTDGPSSVDNTATASTSVDNTPAANTTNTPIANSLYIARDTILLVELESTLSTDVSQRGDKFQARVIEPREFSGAMIEGRITQIKRAGKIRALPKFNSRLNRSHARRAFNRIQCRRG